MFRLVLLNLFVLVRLGEGEELNQNAFPENFKFGVATSSYQVEGAWNVNGKGENIWDFYTHNFPNRIDDRTTGDVACDSYNKYKDDVQLIKSLGVSFYRFSLSWSRILPTGLPNFINPDGIRYYNDLINELIANEIEPMVTIYHWDLPQPLQEIGGWPNAVLAKHFVDFARIAFENFGDRVKTWITFNEPAQICKFGYGDGHLAPGYYSSGFGDYMCAYTVIKAHSAAYDMYNRLFRPSQNGSVGFTIHSYWFEPASNKTEDVEAAERMFQFYTGIYAQPLFGNGDWPDVVKTMVGDASKAQNLTFDRLPLFTAEEIDFNKGKVDFFGLNYYSALVVEDKKQINYPISWDNDARVHYSSESPQTVYVGAQGIRRVLFKLKETYGSDTIFYITENGLGSGVGLQDYGRTNYYLVYLSACLDAIYEDSVKLVGYTAWSLMDNFEWSKGYTLRFGIHDVDFSDPNKPRTRKLSADTFADVVKNRKLPAATLTTPEPTSPTTPSTISSPATTSTTKKPGGSASSINNKLFPFLTLSLSFIVYCTK